VTPADEISRALLRVLASSARGPRREGAFAVWLTVRVAGDLILGPSSVERMHRRRLQALERRLSSLTLPATLRRALTDALVVLRSGTPNDARMALSQLVTPVRETIGVEAAEAVRRMARCP
jgi:hypothetical protein